MNIFVHSVVYSAFFRSRNLQDLIPTKCPICSLTVESVGDAHLFLSPGFNGLEIVESADGGRVARGMVITHRVCYEEVKQKIDNGVVDDSVKVFCVAAELPLYEEEEDA